MSPIDHPFIFVFIFKIIILIDDIAQLFLVREFIKLMICRGCFGVNDVVVVVDKEVVGLVVVYERVVVADLVVAVVVDLRVEGWMKIT